MNSSDVTPTALARAEDGAKNWRLVNHAPIDALAPSEMARLLGEAHYTLGRIHDTLDAMKQVAADLDPTRLYSWPEGDPKEAVEQADYCLTTSASALLTAMRSLDLAQNRFNRIGLR